MHKKSNPKSRRTKTKNSKIIIELIGGTGNQIFQLLACARFAEIHNREPYFTNRLLDGNRRLETLAIANKLKIKLIQKEIIKDLPLLKEEDIIHPAYFSCYPEANYLPCGDVILSGYFQNYRIFSGEHIAKVKSLAKETAKKFINNKNYISIHTRELQAAKNHVPLNTIDNLDIRYYERAFESLRNQLQKDNKSIEDVLLFTDMFKNKEFSKIYLSLKKLIKNHNMNLILGDELCSTAWESVSIMSQSKYIIMSNSTFSWWASYLSRAKVYTPILSLWESRLLTPDNWIQINDGNLSPNPWHKQSFYKKKKILFRKRNSQNKFIRKVKHIINYYILSKTFMNYINKNKKLKIRNILS